MKIKLNFENQYTLENMIANEEKPILETSDFSIFPIVSNGKNCYGIISKSWDYPFFWLGYTVLLDAWDTMLSLQSDFYN